MSECDQNIRTSMRYSQNNEQDVIVDYFDGQLGTFLDIGASDGVTYSNTLRLAELGWTGLAVEAHPHSACDIIRNYESREISSVMVLQALMMPTREIVKFFKSKRSGIATAHQMVMDRWHFEPDSTPLFMAGVTVEELLKAFGLPFQFVSIDAEGFSTDLLLAMDLTAMSASLVCVEHDGNEDQITKHCAAHGLKRLLALNPENIILGK